MFSRSSHRKDSEFGSVLFVRLTSTAQITQWLTSRGGGEKDGFSQREAKSMKSLNIDFHSGRPSYAFVTTSVRAQNGRMLLVAEPS